jgi:hypothetical protein
MTPRPAARPRKDSRKDNRVTPPDVYALSAGAPTLHRPQSTSVGAAEVSLSDSRVTHDSTHHIGGAKGVETPSTNGVTRGNAEFPYAKRREMTSRDLRIHRRVLTPSAPRSPSAVTSKQCLWLVRQSYHRAATLAAIWSAIFNAESAGLALHVLMSIMTLFLSASARPQPQPGALAFC